MYFMKEYTCFVFRKAKLEDLSKIMEMINKAYSIDIGNSGIAFMKGPRLRHLDELLPHFDHLYVMKVEETNEIIGVVKAKLIESNTVGIELLVVETKFQVRYLYTANLSVINNTVFNCVTIPAVL